MLALSELKLLVDCETSQWQYKLDKASIRIDTAQRFKKRTKGAWIYTLVEVNYLISSKASKAFESS